MNQLLKLAFFFVFVFQFNSSALASGVPPMKKVIWVWLENTAYSDMILQKYVKNLWLNVGAGRFSNFTPVSDVTQSNVIAMISGTDFGIHDNDLTRLFTPSIINLLETKNIPWRVYVQDYPGSCYLSVGLGNYKRYRVPFLSLADIQSDRYLCSKVVSFSMFNQDVQLGTTAQFSIVIPNIMASGAETNASIADQTLRQLLDPIVTSPTDMAKTTIIISTTSMKDVTKPAFAMILGNGVNTNGTTSTLPLNHYHFLRTIEDGMGLGHLNQNETKVEPITDIWK